MKNMLSKVFVLLILLGLLTIGYFIYRSYDDKKNSNDNDVLINNYYNSEYLFNSGYIKKANTIDDFSLDDGFLYIYLDDNNTMHTKYKKDGIVYEKSIYDLPNKDIEIYYNHIFDSFYEFVAVYQKKTYYLYSNLSSRKSERFNELSEELESVYVPVYDKDYVFVNKNKKFSTSFILLSSGKLKYLDYDKKYVLKDDLVTKKPYFDYVCGSNNFSICNNLKVYINFYKELVYNGEIIKYKNKHIYVKDVFSSLEIKNSKKTDFSKLSFDQIKKKDYMFIIYIIDKDGIMYQLEISKSLKKLEKINSFSNKVKGYTYKGGNDSSLLIIFADNSKKTIQTLDNKTITTSTIYDKRKQM